MSIYPLTLFSYFWLYFYTLLCNIILFLNWGAGRNANVISAFFCRKFMKYLFILKLRNHFWQNQHFGQECIRNIIIFFRKSGIHIIITYKNVCIDHYKSYFSFALAAIAFWFTVNVTYSDFSRTLLISTFFGGFFCT